MELENEADESRQIEQESEKIKKEQEAVTRAVNKKSEKAELSWSRNLRFPLRFRNLVLREKNCRNFIIKKSYTTNLRHKIILHDKFMMQIFVYDS